MLLVDRIRFLKALKARGFGGISQLSRHLGVHRNSLSVYLNGKAVLPDVLQRALNALDLEALSVLVDVRIQEPHDDVARQISGIVDKLVQSFPAYGYILFGSRATGKNRRYSDVDLGIVGQTRTALPIKVWSEMRNIVDEASSDLPFSIDVVDLGRAGPDFLATVRKQSIFLGGSPQAFWGLQS